MPQFARHARCLSRSQSIPPAEYVQQEGNILLDLREQPVGEEHIGCILHFRNHNCINISAGSFDNINQVTIKELCVNTVGAKGANLAPKI